MYSKRDLQKAHFVSEAEAELAHIIPHSEGVMLFTSIGGYSGSSTRTELAAAIIALAANGPVHIGTESKAFRDRAMQVMRSIRINSRPKRPWKMCTDGDLWEHFEKAVAQKGVNSIQMLLYIIHRERR